MEVFADEVIKLLRSPQERETLGREGRAFVQRYFDWEESGRKLENLCMKAAGFPRIRAA
jgi:glycosyltransferase involved in cell wall biosynthesis